MQRRAIEAIPTLGADTDAVGAALDLSAACRTVANAFEEANRPEEHVGIALELFFGDVTGGADEIKRLRARRAIGNRHIPVFVGSSEANSRESNGAARG